MNQPSVQPKWPLWILAATLLTLLGLSLWYLLPVLR